jgi:hypothetical protein
VSRLTVLVLWPRTRGLRSAVQRRLSQVPAVARVAQTALLHEVPLDAAARRAFPYLSASGEAQVGEDQVEVSGQWICRCTRGQRGRLRHDPVRRT